MCCCSRRGLWRTIAAFSMIVSLVMIAFSICGLLTYNCMFNPGVSKFQMDNFYLTYVVYFYNPQCVDMQSDYIVWKPEPSERTWGWIVAYLVISSVWFFSSLLLMSAPNYWKTSTGLWLTYPWLFITFAVLCTDVASSVMYGLDYSSLETLEDLFNFVSISGKNGYDLSFEYVPVATILMVAIFSKVIVGWILVFLSFLIIYLLLVKVGKPENLILQTRYPIDYYAPAAANPAFESEMTELESSDHLQHPQLSHVLRDRPMLFEDIPWEPKPTQIIPRVNSRYPDGNVEDISSNQQRMTVGAESWKHSRQGSPHESMQNWMSCQEQPSIAPKSILKTAQEGRQFNGGYSAHMPWSYMPPSASEHKETENQNIVYKKNPPSAPTHYSNSPESSMYY